MIVEEWRPVVNYEGFYEVSSLGNVRSLDRYSSTSRNKYKNRLIKGRMLVKTIHSGGHHKVGLSKNGEYKSCLVHHLVAESFLNHTKRNNFICVDHKNEDKLDNRVENLQIITKKENTRKSFYFKLRKFKIGDVWEHNNGTIVLIYDVLKTHGGTIKGKHIYNEGHFCYHKIGVMKRKLSKKEIDEKAEVKQKIQNLKNEIDELEKLI